MITQRDLELLDRLHRNTGALAARASSDKAFHASTGVTAFAAHAPQAQPDSTPMCIAAVLTMIGPCPRPVINDLRAKVGALLATGAQEVVIDLSRVSGANRHLLRAIGSLHRSACRQHACLTLIGAADAFASVLEAATLSEAFLIYRSLGQCPDCTVAQTRQAQVAPAAAPPTTQKGDQAS